MNSIRAWLLDAGREQRIAVGVHELVEVLQDAPVRYVPVAQERFRNALIWRDRVLPVLDLGGFGAKPGESARLKAAILAFQRVPNEPLQYGALLLGDYPLSIQVDDSLAVSSPLETIGFAEWVTACFWWQERPVWVVDPARVFGFVAQAIGPANSAALGAVAEPGAMPAS